MPGRQLGAFLQTHGGNGKSASTPIDTEKPLLKYPDGEDVDMHTYRSMIGSLMYLTSSRLDIMFAVCAYAHFQVTPKVSHLHAVKRIFRYLKGKPHLGLWYPKDLPFNLVAYSDSDYAGVSLDMKSTTGGCQFLGCRLISWQCKKQIVVATLSTEVKYVAATSCCAQVLWIHNQLLDYGIHTFIMTLTFAATHNMIAYLTKSDASEGFDQIIDFLNASLIKYALTVNPNIYVLRIKQFGSSILVKKVNDVMRLQALIDRKKVIITKATIREALRLDDAESIDCLPNEEIFIELSRIGVRKGFSRVETPLFEGIIVAQQADDVAGKVDAGVDVDDVLGADVEPSLPSPTTQPPPPSQELPSTSYVAQALEIIKLKQRVKKLERKNKLKVSRLRRLRKVRTAQRIESFTDTVMDDQEDASKQGEIIPNIDADKDVTLKDVAVVKKTAEIEENTDVQRRPEESQAQIYKIDLKHADKVLSMQDDELKPVELKEVVKVVTTAKLTTEVVTAAAATITAAPTLITDAIITTALSIARRRKGVVIRDLEETATPSIIIHSEPKSKDRGKRIMVEESKLLKKQAQIEQDEAYTRGSGKKKKKKESCMADQNLTAHARNFDIDISFPKLYDLMSKDTTPDVVMAGTNAASPVIMSSVLNSITKEGCGAHMVWLSLDSVHVINDKMKNSLIGKRLAFSVVECTSGADDEGFVEVKKTKSCGNNGGNKNFKLVSVNLKPQCRPKEKQSTKGANQKTTPSVGKKNDSTSRNGTFYISNLFEALNVENSVSEDVETGLEEECVLVDDDGKPLKNVDNLDDHSEDKIESVDNEMTSYLASKPSGVGYGQDMPYNIQFICDNLDIKVPSSIHVFQPSSFFDLEKDGVYMNRQNYNSQFDTGDGFYNAPPPVINSNIMDRQQQVCKESEFQYCDDNSQLLESVIYHTQKKMVNSKKDGHSKIHTAQGPRDRRVRLSIDVARKFFCLQDLLGFDKASKTLDWLFAKSKTAIKDLVEEMKHCSSSSATDQCEMVFQETIRKGSDEEDKYQRKKSETKFFDAKRKKMMRKYKSGVDVNQSRAEARARARERTKEKLHNKKHDEESKKITDNCYRPNHRLVLICPQPADTVISDYK
uniref:Uncharacterized protein n=1 Tax=Tanacetum cinerariifolium TaxID=118510 RepID=A0A699HBM5_TANCI|nr:hypothetical protein [Tanacetum cinerariifolium]